MVNRTGTPIWYELISPDVEKGAAFYAGVLNWEVSSPQGGLDRDYRIASTGGTGVAGLMQAEGATAPRHWFVYFGAADVDETARRAQEAGAAIHVPPTDIPGVGRFAFLADPEGAMFYVMRGASEEDSRAFLAMASPEAQVPQGHAVWNELTASDPAAAVHFYGSVLGIRQEGAMPMGPLGDYAFLHSGPDAIGAVMPVLEGGEPGWLVYFAVDDIDAAVARVRDAGGTILAGPDEIPGGAFSVVAADDQAIRFGLVGPRRARP